MDPHPPESEAQNKEDKLSPDFHFEDYEIEIEEESQIEEAVRESSPPETEAPLETPKATTTPPVAAERPTPEPAPQVKEAPKEPQGLQIAVVVEAGRFHIPLEQLLHLQQGNVLDLKIQPEAGVDLVVDGQCIGRGELIKIGDRIGVRIVEMS